MAPTRTIFVRDTTTSATATATSTSGNNNQTPFLFFIALGLGIVFTNLWVVLGLKYCRRNRQRRLALENGDEQALEELNTYFNPLFASATLANTRRARLERKLITLEDLNRRFPVQKYKEWIADRKRAGLSTEGGISLSAAQEHHVQVQEMEEKDEEKAINENNESTTQQPESKQPEREELDKEQPENEQPENEQPESECSHNDHQVINSDDDNTETSMAVTEEEQQQQSALNPIIEQPEETSQNSECMEQPKDLTEENDNEDSSHTAEIAIDDESQIVKPLNTLDPSTSYQNNALTTESGDACAICLDSIELEDDIRGLTCGHVFHDDCIKRWLTTRKALCPLCKQDYWVVPAHLRRTLQAHQHQASDSTTTPTTTTTQQNDGNTTNGEPRPLEPAHQRPNRFHRMIDVLFTPPAPVRTTRPSNYLRVPFRI